MNPLESRIELQDIAKQISTHPEFQTGKMATALASKVLSFFDPNHVDRKKDYTEQRIGKGYTLCKVCRKVSFDPVLLRCEHRALHPK